MWRINMPIEIKELHIRVAVNTPQHEQSSTHQKVFGRDKANGSNDVDTETIVAECVEQVLQVLRDKMER